MVTKIVRTILMKSSVVSLLRNKKCLVRNYNIFLITLTCTLIIFNEFIQKKQNKNTITVIFKLLLCIEALLVQNS